MLERLSPDRTPVARRTRADRKLRFQLPPSAAWFACHIAAALTAAVSPGCIADERLDADRADAGSREPSLSVYDWSGVETPLERMARKPSIEIDVGVRVDGSNEPAMLLSGAMDQELLEDLGQAPLRSANRQRVVDCAVHYLDTQIIVVPRPTLEPGSVYTLALAGWARTAAGDKLDREGASFHRELVVSDAPDAGARPADSWPADGTAGVGPNLSFAALRFDGEIQGEQEGVWLQDPSGYAVPARVRREPCDAVGWESGTCLRIDPEQWLAASARYRIVVGSELRDAPGSPLGPWSAAFITAAGVDREPPLSRPRNCAVDELETEAGCALVDDNRIRLRLGVNEPAIVRLSTPGREGGPQTSRVAYRGEAELGIADLEPDTPITIEVSARDAAANESSWSLRLRTEADLPLVSITEVRADPRGPEPYQEFIEITNRGETPVDLQGFSLSDDALETGDTIEGSAIAHPGASVLLVADEFDPAEPRDDPVPPGVALVRMGASLAASGLSNSGEPLFLRDPAGRRVSAAPPSPRPRPGICLVRVTADMRDGSEGSFDYDGQGRCTPGY